MPELDLPVDPYVLGCWLGDGISQGCGFICADPEIIDEIERRGFQVRKRAALYAWGILGLTTLLRGLGLIDNKHVPKQYFRASKQQRLDLLAGLMDTDGTANANGSCEFTSCSFILAEAVKELLVSLGIKATIRQGRATINGKDCGTKYRIKFTTNTPVFILPRKKGRQASEIRSTQRVRFITNVRRVESVPVRCIQVGAESALFLAGREMVPTHNSHLLRIAAIAFSYDVPGLQSYLFRRLSPDLLKNHMDGPSGFPVLLAPWVDSGFVKINYSENHISFANGLNGSFSGGSKIFLCHCQYEKNKISYQGAEIHLLLFDELTHFTDSIYRYLRGRLRLGPLEIPDRYKGLFPRVISGANPRRSRAQLG